MNEDIKWKKGEKKRQMNDLKNMLGRAREHKRKIVDQLTAHQNIKHTYKSDEQKDMWEEDKKILQNQLDFAIDNIVKADAAVRKAEE